MQLAMQGTAPLCKYIMRKLIAAPALRPRSAHANAALPFYRTTAREIAAPSPTHHPKKRRSWLD